VPAQNGYNKTAATARTATRYFLFPTSCFLLLGLNNLAALDAAGADLHALGAAARRSSCLNRLKIRVPAPTGYVVRVRDVVTELRSLAAKFTYLCHDIAPKNQTCAAYFQKTPRASPTLLSGLLIPILLIRVSGRHERSRTASLYRVPSIVYRNLQNTRVGVCQKPDDVGTVHAVNAAPKSTLRQFLDRQRMQVSHNLPSLNLRKSRPRRHSMRQVPISQQPL